MKTFLRTFFVAAVAFFSFSAQAELRIEISGVGASQIPIAIAHFANESVAPHKASDVIKADLSRSGMFRVVNVSEEVLDSADVDYAQWRGKGADALLVGRVQRLANGQFTVLYRLYDTVKGAQISAQLMTVTSANFRLAAHRISDDVYEKITGIPGVFSTRIAYISKRGKKFQLEVSDADGYSRQVALRSNEPIMSPSWSPDGTKVAYVSFESKKPVVYVQNLVTRKRIVLANYKGSNSAPAWSPDGTKLALALSRHGLMQLYTVNANGKGLKRLSRTPWIDTEPRFSSDGQMIYFTSDRSGGPQIYRMSANGGGAERITFGSNYNVSPRLARDGKSLAYISRRQSGYHLYVMNLEDGQEMRLSSTNRDESPSFSPNSMYIMYATELNRRGELSVVSIDGRVKHSLSTQVADIREPTWGPFMK